MKITILSFLVLFPALAYSQVGINTIDPKATLDVVANTTESTTIDGIIAPRLTGNELKSKDALYGTDQKGAIIYATEAASPITTKTTNVTTAGYYYFDGSVWQAFTSSGTFTQTDDWHITGNSGTNPDTHFFGTTDDVDFMFTRNNVQAGLLTPDETSFGTGSLPASSTGLVNTAFGAGALQSNTTGFGNSAFGYNALNANTTGNRNSAFGFSTLQSNNASDNNSMGRHALMNNTTGEKNVAVGSGAMQNNIVGSSNTALGDGPMWEQAPGNENTAVGAYTNPKNTGANRNTTLGINANQFNTTGDDNTALGRRANQHNNGPLIGRNIVVIGHAAGASNIDPSNFISIGSSSSSLGDNYIIMGNPSITNAGIQVAWSVTSDKRYKDDIKGSNLGLDFIKELRPVSYLRKNDDSKNREYGFIAQELQETLKKNNDVADSGLVTEDKDTMLSVRYNDLFAPLVKAIQQQQTIITKLKKRLQELEKK